MPILLVIFWLVLAGVAMWFVNNKIPWLTAGWKQLINVVVAIAVVYWILSGVFGLSWYSLGTMPRVPSR